MKILDFVLDEVKGLLLHKQETHLGFFNI